LARCERHGLAYDPAVASGCALCRSDTVGATGLPRLDRVLGGLLAAIVVLLVLGVAWHLLTPAFERALGPTAKASTGAAAAGSEQAPAVPTTPQRDGVRSGFERQAQRRELPQAATEGRAAAPTGHFVLRARNALGRSGALFVPPQAASGPRPLLVLFHGTGGSGLDILRAFLALAERHGVVLLAPDSGRSPDGTYNWQVPDSPGETTPDQQHIKACLDELYATPDLAIDAEHVLAAGHSGGASTAAYQGTRDMRIRAFAVLHGGVFPKGLGSNRVPAWFSTGNEDTLRPPAVVERAAAAAAPYAGLVTTRFYPGGHGLHPSEMSDLFAWWLGA
jgi:predicted esterase